MCCRVVVVVIVGGIPITANTDCEEINCDAAPCPRDALLLTRHGHTATHCNTLQHTATPSLFMPTSESAMDVRVHQRTAAEIEVERELLRQYTL